MLKKLRIKFVIVIMVIITIMYAAVLIGVMHFTKENIERESIQMMSMAAFEKKGIHPVKTPEDSHTKSRAPVVKIEMLRNGKMIVSGGEYYDLSEKEIKDELLSMAMSSEENVGVISEYSMRFLKINDMDRNCVIFADISNEKRIMNGLVRTAVAIGISGYLIFFLISLFLAKWVTKPVEKAWNEQKQFIADASHELKTPLTVITTNTEMLMDSNYSENDREEFTKNIFSMSKRMRSLVESLLELARMDNKIKNTVHEKLNFSKIVSDCTLQFEPLFFEKNMELASKIEKDVYLNGDKGKLRQVVDILLDNALKYSSSDKPVSVEVKHQGNHAFLMVSGYGKPLSKAECENIFKRFYRVDESRNDGHSYGLGLSIAESIVNEHKGKIWAVSENGLNKFSVII